MHAKIYAASVGCQVRTGILQSMPSSNMDNCAGVSETDPESACGQMKRATLPKLLPTKPRCRATTCVTLRLIACLRITVWPAQLNKANCCLLYTSPSPRDG